VKLARRSLRRSEAEEWSSLGRQSAQPAPATPAADVNTLEVAWPIRLDHTIFFTGNKNTNSRMSRRRRVWTSQ
jgi:hypothetical protein